MISGNNFLFLAWACPFKRYNQTNPKANEYEACNGSHKNLRGGAFLIYRKEWEK
jgi:hypothetical protein